MRTRRAALILGIAVLFVATGLLGRGMLRTMASTAEGKGAAMSATSTAVSAKASSSEPTDWAIDGIMSDACQCTVTCPCQFLDKPTMGHCDDTIVLSLKKGHYGRVPLDGQSIVIVSASKDGERVVDTLGDLVFANFYVSDRSTQEQRDALVALTKALLGADKGGGPRLSPVDKVHAVPMTVSVSGSKHRVEIPGILKLESEPISSSVEGKPVTLVHAPAYPPFFGEIVVRKSNTYRYTDDGKDWDYAGRSATSAVFAVDSKTVAAMTEPEKSPINPKPKSPDAHHH